MNFDQQKIEKYYTFEEYLALEEVAEIRHEYHGGKSIYLHSIDATLLLSDIYAKAEDLILDENVPLDEVF